jgi:hypothetical protein
MAMRFILSLGAVIVFAGIASPVSAGEAGQGSDICYWCTRDAIYDLVNRIALLEANPDVDDAVKGPEITADRAEIHRLRAMLGSPPREWSTPCCYARRPLYIR